MNGVERALGLLRNLPRVSLSNLKALPGSRFKKRDRLGQHGRKCGRGNKGQGQRGTLPRIGFEGGATPFYLLIPREPYYHGVHTRRQYPPLSLLQLQRLIDMNMVDVDEPIDLTTLCNTKAFRVNTTKSQYGVNLTDEGADIFEARVHLEVQWTNEQTIAAVERNGGTVTTRFYDPDCVNAMQNPAAFFRKGRPIPRCKLPPIDALPYYSDANNRGYLADPDKIREARVVLAQKYGYALPDITRDTHYGMLTRRKDPRQMWFGLEPGWVVNMVDKVILKPTDETLNEYYKS